MSRVFLCRTPKLYILPNVHGIGKNGFITKWIWFYEVITNARARLQLFDEC